MLNNYQYFIVLAEELNISKAAERLFISHQCLSKYLKNLEQAYQIAFFERSPRLTLTPAGEAYLETLRQVQLLESNLESTLSDIRSSKKGVVRFGTTEGRYRILIPTLHSEFKLRYPEVQLITNYDTSNVLCERIAKNELDIALMNQQSISLNQFAVKPILDERLYLIISDHLLEKYFPQKYPACKKTFLKGIDLRQCQDIPFVLNQPGFNSRKMLNSYLQATGLHLDCVLEMTQQDLHFMLAAKDYAACFCWEMYIPSIQQSNASLRSNHLNVFPIKGMTGTNQVVLVMAKSKILPAYGHALVDLILETCRLLPSTDLG